MKRMIDSKGMSLVEMIVAIAIFGVMSISLLTIFSSGMRMIVRAGNKEETITNASSEIDLYKTNKDEIPGGAPVYTTNLITIVYNSGYTSNVDGFYIEGESQHVESGQNTILRGFRE